ncbi:DUF4065 domain-containing protein [Paraclostridium sordellii 8483]|uniref:Panacea domain-containing protein n=1 Tax=Paraclostridium sordellii TaxID=1505 RepID=UPI0002E25BB9|nr:type II toxin-antitoxin system antitoxin SocA domain-containing protein [Paeniclostridium sordellii]TAN69985.1 DUF4065 domain-containing protein [Paeniclostridium sordellii 8483]CEK35714.1 putative zinc finger/helix-turn-helix protein, YgiT family,Uncharacterized phage-associated protein [[Clostridium] sordellii] [Paeniclostridium sordellii]
MEGKYTALGVSNYIVNYANANGKIITNLQLQKILYYLQGYFLAMKDEKLFEDRVIAWQFGPVVPEVYYEFSIFGSSAIDIKYVMLEETSIDIKDRTCINSIIDLKLDMNVWDLVQETHDEDPWIRATKNGLYTNGEITEDMMKNYFMYNPNKFGM